MILLPTTSEPVLPQVAKLPWSPVLPEGREWWAVVSGSNMIWSDRVWICLPFTQLISVPTATGFGGHPSMPGFWPVLRVLLAHVSGWLLGLGQKEKILKRGREGAHLPLSPLCSVTRWGGRRKVPPACLSHGWPLGWTACKKRPSQWAVSKRGFRAARLHQEEGSEEAKADRAGSSRPRWEFRFYSESETGGHWRLESWEVMGTEWQKELLLFRQWIMSDSESMDCSTPGFPVLHSLLEFAQTHVHWVGDAISNHLILCHPLLLLPSVFPSTRVFSKWVSSSHQAAKVVELQLQHQYFQWRFRVDFL